MKREYFVSGDSNTWGAVPAEGTRHPDDVRWTGILAELGEMSIRWLKKDMWKDHRSRWSGWKQTFRHHLFWDLPGFTVSSWPDYSDAWDGAITGQIPGVDPYTITLVSDAIWMQWRRCNDGRKQTRGTLASLRSWFQSVLQGCSTIPRYVRRRRSWAFRKSCRNIWGIAKKTECAL